MQAFGLLRIYIHKGKSIKLNGSSLCCWFNFLFKRWAQSYLIKLVVRCAQRKIYNSSYTIPTIQFTQVFSQALFYIYECRVIRNVGACWMGTNSSAIFEHSIMCVVSLWSKMVFGKDGNVCLINRSEGVARKWVMEYICFHIFQLCEVVAVIGEVYYKWNHRSMWHFTVKQCN